MKTTLHLAVLLGLVLATAAPASADAYPRYPYPSYPPPRYVPPPPPPRAQPYDRGYSSDITYAAPASVDSGVHGYLGVGGAMGWVGGDTGVRSFGGSVAGGFDLFGGVELGQWLALELDWRYLSLRDDAYTRSSLNEVTAGAKVFMLPRGWPVRPYAALGVGLAVLSPLERNGPRPLGPALDLGVGADIPIGRHFAVGAKLSWRPMFLDASDLGAPQGAGRTAFNDLSLSLRMQVTF